MFKSLIFFADSAGLYSSSQFLVNLLGNSKALVFSRGWTFLEIVFATLAVSFVLLVHGTVPFVMIPTLGQSVWAMGFAQSFASGPLFDFYAHDFGLPKPAAIAFGLAGVWPASLLIRLGLHAADAYASVAAIWLGVSMFSAFQISRRLGATPWIAILGGVAWTTMPIVWAHAGFSMLSWGIGLLSFYFLAAIKLFLIASGTTKIAPGSIALYFIATIVAVFMDGYTFIMFATGASILLLYSFAARPEIKSALLRVAVPTHVVSFALAYGLYSIYIGKATFEAHSIDFFRGWGLDLSFLVIPTKGMLWLPDVLGLSLQRSDDLYFGDASVWTTSFALPVLILGLFAWWRARHCQKISTGVLLITLFSFYMALGPSLKINSTKPESLQSSRPRQQSNRMASEYAVFPTGNAWLSETLPGFNAMRAAYRWSALGIFALWLMIMLQVSCTDRRSRRLWLLALFVLVLLNLPSLEKRWQTGTRDRELFQQIDDDLVTELRRQIRPDETVAFVPWGNDFLVNYLAPRADFRTFNIGGDKNLSAAQANWPPEMLALRGRFDAANALAAVKMLVDGTADVLVLPYFDMLWSPLNWPCDGSTAQLSDKQKKCAPQNPGVVSPSKRSKDFKPALLALQDLPNVEVVDSALFASVRLRVERSGKVKEQLEVEK